MIFQVIPAVKIRFGSRGCGSCRRERQGKGAFIEQGQHQQLGFALETDEKKLEIGGHRDVVAQAVRIDANAKAAQQGHQRSIVAKAQVHNRPVAADGLIRPAYDIFQQFCGERQPDLAETRAVGAEIVKRQGIGPAYGL